MEKTDNEIIAAFMGLRRQETGEYNKVSYWKPDLKDSRNKGSFFGYFDSLLYDEDWNRLMPVVERISEFGAWTIRPDFALIENYKGELRQSHQFKFIKSTGDFEEVGGESVSWCFVVACVAVEFIKWYEESKNK